PGARPIDRLGSLQHRETRGVGPAAPLRPVGRVETRAALVALAKERPARLALAVIGQVFGEMSGALGDEGAEVQAHVLPHQIELLVGASGGLAVAGIGAVEGGA